MVCNARYGLDRHSQVVFVDEPEQSASLADDDSFYLRMKLTWKRFCTSCIGPIEMPICRVPALNGGKSLEVSNITHTDYPPRGLLAQVALIKEPASIVSSDSFGSNAVDVDGGVCHLL